MTSTWLSILLEVDWKATACQTKGSCHSVSLSSPWYSARNSSCAGLVHKHTRRNITQYCLAWRTSTNNTWATWHHVGDFAKRRNVDIVVNKRSQPHATWTWWIGGNRIIFHSISIAPKVLLLWPFTIVFFKPEPMCMKKQWDTRTFRSTGPINIQYRTCIFLSQENWSWDGQARPLRFR